MWPAATVPDRRDASRDVDQSSHQLRPAIGNLGQVGTLLDRGRDRVDLVADGSDAESDGSHECGSEESG